MAIVRAGDTPLRRQPRPLGAALPLPERAAALEARVRDYTAAVDELLSALRAYDRAKTWTDEKLAENAFGTALVRLQDLAESNIRRLRRA